LGMKGWTDENRNEDKISQLRIISAAILLEEAQLDFLWCSECSLSVLFEN
jgi:hypothetical protein